MKFKNEETEMMCEEVSTMYWSEGHPAAMKHFQAWADDKKLLKWEYHAIIERIKTLIMQKKGTL